MIISLKNMALKRRLSTSTESAYKLQYRRQVVQRNKNGYNEYSDAEAEHNDKGRFNQTHKVIQKVVHVAPIEAGGTLQNKIKLAGFLPYFNHLGNQWRNFGVLLKRVTYRISGFYRLTGI